MRSAGRFMTIAAIVAAVFVIAPAGAMAGKFTPKRTKPLNILTGTATETASGPGQLLSATATCPPGTRAMGGGWSAPPDPGNHLFAPFESVRVGESQWRVSGGSMGTPTAPQSLTVEVYCAKLHGRVATAVETLGIGGKAGEQMTKSASCQTGTWLLSGGFSGPAAGGENPTLTSAYENQPDDSNGWAVEMVRLIPGAPSVANTFAYCLRTKNSTLTAAQKRKLRKRRQRRARAHAAITPVSGGKRKKRKHKTAGVQNPRHISVRRGYGTFPVHLFDRSTMTSPACVLPRWGISGGYSTSYNPMAIPIFTESRLVNGAWTATAVRVSGEAPAGAPMYAFVSCA